MSINIGGLVLNKILTDPSNDISMEAWSRLKITFFGAEYISIYTAINAFYNKRGFVPTFNDLNVSLRDGLLKKNVKALSVLKVPEDIDLGVAVDSLIDEFTQTETLKQIETLVDNITLLDTEEIKAELTNIQLYIEEKTHTSEKICLMSDITMANEKELENTRVALGINNTFDAEIMPATSELIMIGGKRGAGKSVVSANVCINQYEQGESSLYFSIEMGQRETYNRFISILSGVSNTSIKKGELERDDYDRIAKVRADMFLDAGDLLDAYGRHGDFNVFEADLVKNHKLKPDNQIVIIDNQRLTLADIDMNIQKFKGQFGNKLKTVIVDYVNQIEIDDIYNWQQQIVLSKQLKNIARKHDVCMVTPYQIDASGEARFSKGLLDAADVAFILQAEKDHIKIETTKTRGSAALGTASGIEWKSLRMDAEDYIDLDAEGEGEGGKYDGPEPTDEEMPF